MSVWILYEWLLITFAARYIPSEVVRSYQSCLDVSAVGGEVMRICLEKEGD